jgi:UDP-N-acetylglucosamine:LPS N-acetylglucosamine transferase
MTCTCRNPARCPICNTPVRVPLSSLESSAGAAILLPQKELTPERLALVERMSRDQLLQMAEKARALAKPEAAAAVAAVCMEIAR